MAAPRGATVTPGWDQMASAIGKQREVGIWGGGGAKVHLFQIHLVVHNEASPISFGSKASVEVWSFRQELSWMALGLTRVVRSLVNPLQILTILHWRRKLCLKTNTFDAQFQGCSRETDGDELSLTPNNMLWESGMQTTCWTISVQNQMPSSVMLSRRYWMYKTLLQIGKDKSWFYNQNVGHVCSYGLHLHLYTLKLMYSSSDVLSLQTQFVANSRK